MLRPDQAVSRADVVEISQHRFIAGQHQMIAVVDHHVDRGIMVGAAAAAGLVGGLMQRHIHARSAQPCRRGEAGHTGANDMD